MGDPIHHPSNSNSPSTSSNPKTTPSRISTPPSAPSPRTYIVKVPKDRVYRVPPPENAQKFNQIAQRKTRRCHCCFWLIGILFTLITLLAIAAGIFYLVVRPKLLEYSISTIDIRGFNSTLVSPEFNVTIMANNPNRKIGFRYVNDSSITILFKDVVLCNGVLPGFYQPPNNVTVVKTTLESDAAKVRSLDLTELVKAEKKRKVPLTVKLTAPLKIKVGAVETGPITVKIDCDVTVDKLAASSNIVFMHCRYTAYVLWSFKI